jgi:hypothetical protein
MTQVGRDLFSARHRGSKFCTRHRATLPATATAAAALRHHHLPPSLNLQPFRLRLLCRRVAFRVSPPLESRCSISKLQFYNLL